METTHSSKAPIFHNTDHTVYSKTAIKVNALKVMNKQMRMIVHFHTLNIHKHYSCLFYYLGRVKQICCLLQMLTAKVQASLCIRTVSPEPPLLAHSSNESRRTFRQKTRSLAPLNGWACAVEIWHDGTLEDTNSLDAPHLTLRYLGARDTSFKCTLLLGRHIPP